MAGSRLYAKDAAGILDSGGVLILSTDTLPGFHCRADRVQAVRRIAELKERSEAKPFLVLAADLKQAGLVIGSLNKRQRDYCDRCWPGPFTLILPAALSVAQEVTAGSNSVAVRVPDLPELQTLLRAVGHPLVSTSANIQGQDQAKSLADAVDSFSGQVDGWHDCWTNTVAKDSEGSASALLDLNAWPPVLLRPGPKDPPEVVS